MKDYQRELGIIFGAICDGIRQEVRQRLLLYLQNKRERRNFCITAEHERGIVSIFTFHLRNVGFIARPEHYWCNSSEISNSCTPDLVVWLPKTHTDLFLQVKPIYSTGSYQNADLSDLDTMCRLTDENGVNGFLAFGFCEKHHESKLIEEKYKVSTCDVD